MDDLSSEEAERVRKCANLASRIIRHEEDGQFPGIMFGLLTIIVSLVGSMFFVEAGTPLRVLWPLFVGVLVVAIVVGVIVFSVSKKMGTEQAKMEVAELVAVVAASPRGADLMREYLATSETFRKLMMGTLNSPVPVFAT